MEDTRDETLHLIDFANGEIRIQAIRYGIRGCNFMCLIALIEKNELFWERFDDMVGGDNDYFMAEKWLQDANNQNEEMFSFAYGADPVDAYNKAKAIADRIMESK